MRGRLFAVAAGVTYGTLGIFGKLFYDHGGDSFTLLVLRFCGAWVLFAAVVLWRRRPRPARPDALAAVVLGPAQLAATFCLFVGFEHASPGLVVLLFYIYPLLVTLGAKAIFGEALGRGRAALLGVGMAGIALTVGLPQSTSALGVVCGVAAGLFTAIFILGSRHAMRGNLDAFQFIALAYTGSALGLLAAALVHGIGPVSGSALVYAGLVVVAGTVVPALFFYSAIRLVGPGAAARLATVEPLTAVVLSFLVLGDSLGAGQIAGGALVLASVALLAVQPRALRREATLTAAKP
jgi:drug/metabolite transporter (DMT)-like permease